MKKFKIPLFVTSLFLGILIVSADKADAANLYFNPNEKQVAVGDVVQMEILLDAEQDDINAAEVKVSASGEFLKLKDWSDGGSLINYWAEKASVDKTGILKFQGVIIGGFKGKGGKLLTLYYEALKPGKASVSIETFTTVYLNDGLGTKANLTFTGAMITIGKEETAEEVTPMIDIVPPEKRKIISIIDTVPPETVEAELSRSKDFFDGQWFLAFSASDSGSGMDYFEVKEGDGDWIRAESPYLLINQKTDHDIFIKAVDKNGNSKIITLKFRQYELVKTILSVLAALLIVVAVLWILRKRKK